jgi:hypothetical protein
MLGTMADVLVATWSDGIFAVSETSRAHELAGCSIRGLASDGQGEVLAIVDGRTLRRRSSGGGWTTWVTTDHDLSCCVAGERGVYVGTNDARVFQVTGAGELVPLEAFAHVEGRESWYAGQALVNGQLMGPPLGVRSISMTADGALLANVHVGGVPRSSDGGASWRPTIAVDADVHEVRAHPTRPELVAAAAGVGLCLSTDGGVSWTIQSDGLHAPHCSAVAFVGDDVLVSASVDPFSDQGRVYRASLDRSAPLTPLGGGLPEWTAGKVDTYCIGVGGWGVAFADRDGNVYVSRDGGIRWSTWPHGLPPASSVLVL